MDTYSITLLIALLTTSLAVLGALATRFVNNGYRFAQPSRTAGILSMILGAFAFMFHLFSRHTPGSDTAMGSYEFISNHPAPLVIILVGALSVWLAGISRKTR